MRQKIIGGSVCLTLCSSLLGLFCGMVTKLFPRFWFYPFPSHTQTQNTSLHFPVISLFFALFLFPNLILPQLKFIFQSRPIESCRLVFTRCIYFHSFFFFFSQLFCVLLLKVCCFYVGYLLSLWNELVVLKWGRENGRHLAHVPLISLLLN